jgi:membrane protease YdiL (CAAX protease family)
VNSDRARSLAPALAAALVLGVGAFGVVLSAVAWAIVLLLAAWAAWYFRIGRMGDGAVLTVALTMLATYAIPLGMFLVPFPALLSLFILAYWRDPPEPPLPWLRMGLFGWTGAVAALAVAIAGGAAAWGAVALMPSRLNGCAWARDTESWLHMTAGDLASRALMVGIIGGGAEEALFRGALQERLTRALGPLPAVFVQAVAYAAYSFAGLGWAHLAGLHGGARLGAGAAVGLVLGFLLGVLRQLSDGLFAPWVAHALANVVIRFVVRAVC